MANIISRHIGISKNGDYETKKNLREHGVKGIKALRESYNVECFEDITPSVYMDCSKSETYLQK